MNQALMAKVALDAEGKYFLTDEQIDKLTQKLLAILPWPKYIEDIIQVILPKIIKKIDGELYKLLPNEIYDFINDDKKGFSEGEGDEIEERIIKIVNDLIDIPFLNEQQEELLISAIIHLIFEFMKKGFKL